MKATVDFLKENKLTIIMATLFVLVMMSFSVIGNLLAKYTSSADAVDVARVAKFSITETGFSEITVTSNDFRPGYTLIQPIEIDNKSEVAVEYTLTVELLTENLPISMSLNEQSGKKIVINKKLQPNSGKENYNLNIVWPKELNNLEYSMMVDAIRLSLNAVQIN
jgi:hypothetical protein